MSSEGLSRLAFALHEHENARHFSTDERRDAAKAGAALPDGSFPILNATDLHNAIRAVGRSNHPASAVRAHIIKRAKALGLTAQLPDSYRS
jgi:hypothetical protein